MTLRLPPLLQRYESQLIFTQNHASIDLPQSLKRSLETLAPGARINHLTLSDRELQINTKSKLLAERISEFFRIDFNNPPSRSDRFTFNLVGPAIAPFLTAAGFEAPANREAEMERPREVEQEAEEDPHVFTPPPPSVPPSLRESESDWVLIGEDEDEVLFWEVVTPPGTPAPTPTAPPEEGV